MQYFVKAKDKFYPFSSVAFHFLFHSLPLFPLPRSHPTSYPPFIHTPPLHMRSLPPFPVHLGQVLPRKKELKFNVRFGALRCILATNLRLYSFHFRLNVYRKLLSALSQNGALSDRLKLSSERNLQSAEEANIPSPDACSIPLTSSKCQR